MTVAEAVKASKSRGLFSRGLIRYAQESLKEDEDLICAAVVTVTRCCFDSAIASSLYLSKMQSSAKFKALLCATTKRLVFFNNTLGAKLTYELPLCENPRMETGELKRGIGVDGLKLFARDAEYFISANRKLIRFLRSGISAAFMIFGDQYAKKVATEQAAVEALAEPSEEDEAEKDE